MAMKCGKCSEDVLAEDTLTCCLCAMNAHYLCVGTTEANFRKMSKIKKDTWKCLDCKAKKNETFTIPSQSEAPELKQMFEKFSKEIKATLASCESNIQKNTDQMKEVLESIKDVKTVLESLEAKQEKLEKENENMKKSMDEMKKELEAENKMLKRSIEETKNKNEDQIDFLENRSRICNLEIRGVPETKNEDVVKIIYNIGKEIGIQSFSEGDVQVAHRVDTRSTQEHGKRPIIAHLASRYLRNKWLQHYKNYLKNKNVPNQRATLSAKSIDDKLADVPVFLNEHITVKRKLLLKEAKDVAKAIHFKFVWVKDAFILMKQNENARHVQKINSRQELAEYQTKFQSSFSS
ncbi:hypothetical protein M8J77_012970 [Diaphorina citri]|nr:hypothetical protein M8J77_012970 [Diaphorina citri]